MENIVNILCKRCHKILVINNTNYYRECFRKYKRTGAKFFKLNTLPDNDFLNENKITSIIIFYDKKLGEFNEESLGRIKERNIVLLFPDGVKPAEMNFINSLSLMWSRYKFDDLVVLESHNGKILRRYEECLIRNYSL